MPNKETIVTFKCTVIRKTYGGDNSDYKIYAVDVDRNKYPNIKFTKYGNATILGELHELGIGSKYIVKAKEENTKYGYSYKVINIKRDSLNSATDMYVFLQEILTQNQAETLYNVYPDIVERVMHNNLDDIDLNKLPGIKEYTFNIIKNKIVENYCLAELVVEFEGLISFNVLKKLYDKYTSVKLIKKNLREDPYKCLCGLARIGFSKADSILLQLEESTRKDGSKVIDFGFDLKTSKQRCLSCVLYILEKNEEEGNTWMGIIQLREQVIKLTPSCSDYFVECLKHESVYYDKDKLLVALNRTYEIEKYIADQIKYGLSVKNKWDFDLSKYDTVEGCSLSDEQKQIVKNVCENNICILNGAAGTGKSFSTQAVIQMLKDNNKTFKIFAPTGKASKVISDYTKEIATTIHRGLGYMPPDTWNYNVDEKLLCDIVIIDEFSMTDIFLFKHVIDAINFNVTKLLLIGDNAQLPSVSCGNLMHDFMESNIIPKVTLSKVFRYGEGGLMKVATDVRYCKPYLDNIENQFTWFGSNKDYAFIATNNDNIVKSAVGLYKKLLTQGYTVNDIQVLTSYKKGNCGTQLINNEIQKVANKNYRTREYMKVGDTVYYKGDIVIQNVNNYHAKLYFDFDCDYEDVSEDKKETFIANGEIGIIEEVTPNYLVINFDNVRVQYYRDDMQMVGLGYCITIHKSQGSSSKVIILLTPSLHTYMLNSNLIYVGLTRMKEKCFHLGSINTVNSSIKKKENFKRNTLLKGLLRGDK